MESSTTARRRKSRCLTVKNLVVMTAGISAAVLLAACGGGSSNPSSSSAPTMSGAPSGDLQAEVNIALNTDSVDAGSLEPAIQAALARAAIPLTPDQIQLAYECWSTADCTIPGGGDQVVGYISPEFNTWRKFARMEVILQAITYPEVGRIISVMPGYDLAQMQAGVRKLTDDGATVIISYNDFGPALASAFKTAQAAGAKVGIFVGPSPGTGTDSIATQVTSDVCNIGKAMAERAIEMLGTSGKIAFFNGTRDNPQGAAWNKCAEDVLAAQAPDIKVVFKVDTNWTLRGAFDAANALIASGANVNIIMSDYVDPMTQVVKAYDQAGKKIPDLMTWTSNNELLKEWSARQGTDMAFRLEDTNSLTWSARVALSNIMNALVNGTDVPALSIYPQPFVEATPGDYKADGPADYPGRTTIPDELVNQMLAPQ